MLKPGYEFEAFLRKLINSKAVVDSDRTLEAIIQTASECNYVLPLKLINKIQESNLRLLEKDLASYPIKISGNWFSFGKIIELKIDDDVDRLKGRLEKVFLKNPKDALPENASYWISSENIGLIDENGVSVPVIEKASEYLKTSASHRTLQKEISRLEKHCSEVGVENGASGIRMRIKDLVRLGTSITQQTLWKNITTQSNLFDARKENERGGPWSFLVTQDNYKLLGLNAYPGTSEGSVEYASDNKKTNGDFLEMSISELKLAGSKYHPVYLTQKINRHKEKFTFRKDRGKLMVRVTPDNYEILGLPKYPDLAPTHEKESPITIISLPKKEKSIQYNIQIGGEDISFSSTATYSPVKIAERLTGLNSDIFTEQAREIAIGRLKDEEGYVSGSKLIDFLKKVNGIMKLGTTGTMKKVEGYFGIGYDSLVENLRTPGLSRYIHTLEGIVPGEYILKSELELIKRDLGSQ